MTTSSTITLHFTIEPFLVGEDNVIEVAACGAEVAKRAGKGTATTKLSLGHLRRDGTFWQEWALYLDLPEEWVKAQIPESLKEQAWGNRR